MLRQKFWRATYGNTFYCGWYSPKHPIKLQVNVQIFTFYKPASESFLAGEFNALSQSLASECGEHPEKRGYEATPVDSSESRGLGFYRLIYLLDNNEEERFDLRQHGRVT